MSCRLFSAGTIGGFLFNNTDEEKQAQSKFEARVSFHDDVLSNWMDLNHLNSLISKAPCSDPSPTKKKKTSLRLFFPLPFSSLLLTFLCVVRKELLNDVLCVGRDNRGVGKL